MRKRIEAWGSALIIVIAAATGAMLAFELATLTAGSITGLGISLALP
jgi:hypothetical protein